MNVPSADAIAASAAHLPVAQSSSGGGPYEPAVSKPGVAGLGQRYNAVKHGCSATTLVESIIGTDRVAALTAELTQLYAPMGAVEAQLVRRIAQHMAALDLSTAAEHSAIRAVINQTNSLQGILQATALAGGGGCTCLSADEPCRPCQDLYNSAVMAAVASEPVAKIGKYARQHNRGVTDAIQLLEQLQARRLGAAKSIVTVSGVLASGAAGNGAIGATRASCAESIWLPDHTEADCIALFLRWRPGQRIPCPECGTRAPVKLISGRNVLRCQECRHQYGLRYGTLLANSKLPFLAWVRAIRLLAQSPHAAASDIATASGGIAKRPARQLKIVILREFKDPARREQLLTMAGLRKSGEKAALSRKPR